MSSKKGTRTSKNIGDIQNGAIDLENLVGDFLIRDSIAIESWSYGTAEHYDEIVRDLKRLLYSDQKFYPYFYPPFLPSAWKGNKAKLEQAAVPEIHPATEETLKKGLLEMIRMILKGEGRIHYATGVCANRALHFATDRPTYFKS